MMTGIIITGAVIFGIVKIMYSPVGQALGRRISGRSAELDDDLRNEVHDLRDQVDDLHRQLGETQERLDFTERLLTRGKSVAEER